MKILEIIWDHRVSEGFAFDVKLAGFRFEAHRDMKDSTKTIADLTATTRRFGGYRYISARQAFMPAYQFAGSADDRAAKLIHQLSREGWIIQHRGNLPPCLVSDNIQIAA